MTSSSPIRSRTSIETGYLQHARERVSKSSNRNVSIHCREGRRNRGRAEGKMTRASRSHSLEILSRRVQIHNLRRGGINGGQEGEEKSCHWSASAADYGRGSCREGNRSANVSAQSKGGGKGNKRGARREDRDKERVGCSAILLLRTLFTSCDIWNQEAEKEEDEKEKNPPRALCGSMCSCRIPQGPSPTAHAALQFP
eukprot:3940460-Rhodomonas_salina.3